MDNTLTPGLFDLAGSPIVEATGMAKPTLYPYQDDAMNAVRHAIAEGHKRICLVSPTGSGKCLAKDTPVMLASGEIVPVQNIRTGDQLMGDDGTPRAVLSTCSGEDEMFRVTPKKGDAYVVNSAHILSLRNTSGGDGMFLSDGTHIEKGQDVVDVELQNYLKSNGTVKHCLKGYRAEQIDLFHRPFETITIDPYCLGAWLGDGTQTKWAISKPECNMVRRWIEYSESYWLTVKNTEKRHGKCPTWYATGGGNRNVMLERLDQMGLRQEKHIPDAYKYGSKFTRLQLLAGMIDSDGSISRGGCDWLSKSERMADDFAFVCRSLGLSCYLSKQRKGIKSIGFSAEYWRASVSGDLDKLPMRDKIAAARTQKKRHLVHGIKVEPIGPGEYFGFVIDGNRRFLLGDFTVTHNTVMGAYTIDSASDKGKRSAFLVDRLSLIDQTSRMYDRYGIEHGVMQGNHPRYEPHQYAQICSIQTLARREFPHGLRILVWDEAHTRSKPVLDFIKANPDVVVLGLTATPFTPGMGEVFTKIVNVTTTQRLIETGFLAPLKVFIAKAANMKGVKKNSKGEYDDDASGKQSLTIMGDVIADWTTKTHEFFGGPEKTIMFTPNVASGEEYCRAFNELGHNFMQISYKTPDKEREMIMKEFAKPWGTGEITGVISVEALAKGFDQPDIRIGIGAKPYIKSFSGHIQQIGRAMRSFPGKDFAVWNDHSQNFARFSRDMEELFEHGYSSFEKGDLDKRARKDPTAKELKDLKCGRCSMLMRGKKCLHCGWERPSRASTVENIPGQLDAYTKASNEVPKGKEWMLDRGQVWQEICGYAIDKKKGDMEAASRFAKAQFKNMYDAWPKKEFADTEPLTPSDKVSGKIRSQLIAWARSKR